MALLNLNDLLRNFPALKICYIKSAHVHEGELIIDCSPDWRGLVDPDHVICAFKYGDIRPIELAA